MSNFNIIYTVHTLYSRTHMDTHPYSHSHHTFLVILVPYWRYCCISHQSICSSVFDCLAQMLIMIEWLDFHNGSSNFITKLSLDDGVPKVMAHFARWGMEIHTGNKAITPPKESKTEILFVVKAREDVQQPRYI